MMPIKLLLYKIRKKIIYNYRKYKLIISVRFKKDIKIIVGAALTSQYGWFSTNEQWLDITKIDHWRNIFGNRRIVSGVVAEHVFEHLEDAESKQALLNIALYLKDGGRIRIAVPDGFNPNNEYIMNVDIQGIGPDASDHKQLFNINTLSGLLIECGYKPKLVEGYLESGELVQNSWSEVDGFIKRSRQNQNTENNGWNFIDASTSLIVDGVIVR